jgi:hypothetical protein
MIYKTTPSSKMKTSMSALLLYAPKASKEKDLPDFLLALGLWCRWVVPPASSGRLAGSAWCIYRLCVSFTH